MKKIVLILLILLSIKTIAQINKDCPPRLVCSNYTSDKLNGAGVQQLNTINQGCLSTEHNSDWITISIATSGTLEFTITPLTNSDDFDFAVWGPNSACSPNTTPIRCSWADVAFSFLMLQPTGVNTINNAGQGDLTEGATGNFWVDDMNVIAGETYLILIDDYTQSNKKYSISFGGTSTIVCSSLPIELTSLTCQSNLDNITINWTTATETNNDKFQLMRSTDGLYWTKVAELKGAGTSTEYHNYTFIDYMLLTNIYYYKLIQVDYDGKSTTSKITSCSYTLTTTAGVTIKYYNMLDQLVDINNAVHGFYVKEYSNGSFIKRELFFKN